MTPFRSLKTRFPSKATCYPSQCPYPVGKLPESLIKKNAQSAKSKLAAGQRTLEKSGIKKKGFESPKEMKQMLVEEDFQMAKKQIRKKPSSSFINKVNNEHAKSFLFCPTERNHF